MSAIVTILVDGFADWETGLLNATARAHYGSQIHYASPGGRAVVSMGGLHVQPDLALDAIDLSSTSALILCGGTGWTAAGGPDLAPLLLAASAERRVIGAICDGTLALARSGLLNDIAHTSNAPGHLEGSGYAGAARYRDVPGAVRSGHIITAPGTAPVSFMAEVMRAVGLADANLDYYLGMFAAEHAAVAATA